MAVAYNIGDSPEDYGLHDWWHDEDGRVNYSWDAYTCQWYHENNSDPIDFKALAASQDNSYDENCTEEALDNLAYERYRRSAMIEGFEEWERNQIQFN